MGGKSVYYDPCVVALLPNRDHFKFSVQTRDSNWGFSKGWNDTFNGFKGVLPTKTEISKFFIKNNYCKNKDDYYIDSNFYNNGEYIPIPQPVEITDFEIAEQKNYTTYHKKNQRVNHTVNPYYYYSTKVLKCQYPRQTICEKRR